jgi:hypothetical protein
MDIINLITFLSSLNWLEIVGAITTILTVLIAIFEFIPSDQPEKTLKAIVAFLERYSRK